MNITTTHALHGITRSAMLLGHKIADHEKELSVHIDFGSGAPVITYEVVHNGKPVCETNLLGVALTNYQQIQLGMAE